jgi:hypothetical protein
MKRLAAAQSADDSSGADITSVEVAPVNESLSLLDQMAHTWCMQANYQYTAIVCFFFVFVLASLQNCEKLLLASSCLFLSLSARISDPKFSPPFIGHEDP